MTPSFLPSRERAQPDASQALAFFAALFPTARGEIVHFRGVPEPHDGRAPKNLHYALDEHFRANVQGFLDWCAVDKRAAFFLPGIVKGNGTTKDAVQSLPAILCDFDKDDPSASLGAAEALIGPATIVIESGGRAEKGPKLHAYWRLAEPAMGLAIGVACSVREGLAIRFGGDPAFKQPAQVIRVPGSIHYKGEPKLVKLHTVRPEAVYPLEHFEKFGLAKPGYDKPHNAFDFSNARPRGDIDRVLTQPVHEGAVDDITRFEAASKALGHFIRMVRDGRMTGDEAWEAAKGWNAARMVPPWPEERLRTDFDRLVRRDIEDHGPVTRPEPIVSAVQTDDWAITAWRADRFVGAPPERTWLVEGLIPTGTAGVFAAVGDAGKSMMALQLALHIATAPPPMADSVLDSACPRFFGRRITGRGAAVVLTAEDDAAEVHRRIHGLDSGAGRAGKPLYVIPMLATGGARTILVDGPNGPQKTPFWEEARAQLLAIPDLRLVVLDPLSSFVGADINKDNVAGAALMTMLGELSATTGAAVMLIHHFAKATVPTDLTNARAAIRGASALVDNSRWALAMWEAEQDKAYSVLKTLGQQERAKQAGIVYFGGLVKGNAPGAKTMRTLARNSTTGLLEDVTETVAAATPKPDEVDEAVYRAIYAHKMEHPRWSFPISKNSVAKYIRPILIRAKLDISLRAVEMCLDRLVERGMLVATGENDRYEPVGTD